LAHSSRTRHLIGGEYYVFRDAVHNLISVDDEAEGQNLRRLLRTYELQRLRRIRQNGLASLVYPSLENSRFAHALGTFAVAKKVTAALQHRSESALRLGMPQSLALSPELALSFCFAALVHDVGHGPLSHVWEDLIDDISPSAQYQRRHHELLTEQILTDPTTDIGTQLSKTPKLLNDILGFLRSSHPVRYLTQLLSGPLDVDRLDFMGRDTRSAGVTYGFHELDWMVRSLRFAHRPAARDSKRSEWVIALDGRKGLTTISQFLEARANMYRLVYLHRTARAASRMLILAVRRYLSLREAGINVPCSSPALAACLKDPRHASVAEFIKIDDGDVWNALKMWADHEDEVLRRLAGGLVRRDLFKVVELENETVFQRLKDLSSPAMGQHLQAVVARQLEIDESLAQYYFSVEPIAFDLVGSTDEAGTNEMWIIQSGRFGPRFETMQSFWTQKNNITSTREQKYLLIADARVLDQLMMMAERVSLARGDAVTVEGPSGFRIVGRLGSGALKETFLGAGTDPGKAPEGLVALKRYRGEDTVVDEAVKRDVTTPNLVIPEHENLTKARVLTSPSGDTWLSEPLWTASLSDMIREEGKTRDLEQILEIGVQLFAGLAAIHKQGLRHTDIKPENCGIIVIGRTSATYVIGDWS
jgi:hypothetical protein